MIELTLKELVESYGEYIVTSTKDSIIRNNYRLRTSVKSALITQLECNFEKVEYMAGTRSAPARIKLGELKKVSEEYLGSRLGGRAKLNFSQEYRLLNNWVSTVRPMYDKKNIKTLRTYTPSLIVREAFELKEIDKVVEILLLETDNDFMAFTYFKRRGYNQEDYQIEQMRNHVIELTRLYKDTLRRLEKQLVERWLEDNSKVNYRNVYIAKNKKKYFKITKQEFLKYKDVLSSYRKLLEDLNMKKNNIDRNLNIEIRRVFDFDFAYLAYEFSDNEYLKKEDFDLEICRNTMFSRLMQTAKTANEKSNEYDANWNIEFDNISIRLKRLKEFEEVSEIVWSVIFGKLDNENDKISILINEINEKYHID